MENMIAAVEELKVNRDDVLSIKPTFVTILFKDLQREWKRHYTLMAMMERGDDITDYGYEEE